MLRASLKFLLVIAVVLPASAQVQVIRMGVSALPDTPVSRGADLYRNEVNRRLEGIARIDVVPVVGNGLAAAMNGEVDLVVLSTTTLAAQKSLTMALFDMPYFFRDLTELTAVQRTAVGDAMLNAANADKIVGLAYWNNGMSRIFGYKPIVKLEDFKGLKLRTSVSPSGQQAIRSMGATIPQIPFAEVYTALNTGTITAIEAPPVFIASAALPIVPGHYSYSNISYRPVVSIVAASEAFWKGARYRVQSVLSEQAQTVAAQIDIDAKNADQLASAKLEQGLRMHMLTPNQFEAFSGAAQGGWRKVDALQQNKFMDAALSARQEVRRANYVVPYKQAAVASKGSFSNVFFITDRKDEKDSDPAYRFGGVRGELTWGWAEVTVDPQRQFGSGDVDSVQLQRIATYAAEAAFTTALSEYLAKNSVGTVLLVVHGYRNTFKAALESAAQISADTKSGAAIVVFSWPSDGAAARYPNDGEEVQGSRDNFITALNAISRTKGVQKINLMTHSMGGRLAAYSLEWLFAQPQKGRPRLNHLVLAAPDIRLNLFQQASAGMRGMSRKVTLYSSEWDQALLCSQYYHNQNRAGQAGSNIVVMDNLDTVDASAVEKPSLIQRAYSLIPCTPAGHSYLSRNPAVLADLHELLTYDALPDSRQRLIPKKKEGRPYWLIRH